MKSCENSLYENLSPSFKHPPSSPLHERFTYGEFSKFLKCFVKSFCSQFPPENANWNLALPRLHRNIFVKGIFEAIHMIHNSERLPHIVFHVGPKAAKKDVMASLQIAKKMSMNARVFVKLRWTCCVISKSSELFAPWSSTRGSAAPLPPGLDAIMTV